MEQTVHEYIKTLKTKKQQLDFRRRFFEYNDEIGEVLLFREGITAKYIMDIFNAQGRWAGVYCYINVDSDGKFYTTERTFGGR